VRNIPFGKPIIGENEKRAVADVLTGPILVHGPKAKEFEEKFAAYIGPAHAVSVSSCTAALHLAYFDLGIGQGDEVIVPAQTHIATAHAVEFTGARPVFVDAEIKTGNIDAEQIEDAVTESTKAISVVHFLGMPVDMDRINDIAGKYDLFVLEDCALAIGTYYKGIHAGLLGDAGCFSFYPVKHMTTAEGGMLVTRHEDLASRIQRKKAFGVDRHMGERKIPGIYDVTMLGFNYRLNEIQAALGIEQFQSSHDEYQSSYFCLSVLLKDSLSENRYEIVSSLKQNGVGTSVYYPKPVPHMTYFRDKYGYSETSFPDAKRISSSSIAFPVGPHLGIEDMNYIRDTLKNAIKEAI
jgi:perosamine synthetase